MTNVSNEEWEERFYEITKMMDGQYRPKLKLLLEQVRSEAYQKGYDEADIENKVNYDSGRKAALEEMLRIIGGMEFERTTIAESRVEELCTHHTTGYLSALADLRSKLKEL